MNVIYIVIKVLYGIVVVEASNNHMIFYSIYEGNEHCSNITLYDFKNERAFRLKSIEDTIQRFELDHFINEKIKPFQKKKEIKYSIEREIVFLGKYKGVEAIIDYQVENVFNKFKARGEVKIKKNLVHDLELRSLGWTDESYSLLPFIGSTIMDKNLFSVSSYDVTNTTSDKLGMLLYKISDVKIEKSFSENSQSILIACGLTPY